MVGRGMKATIVPDGARDPANVRQCGECQLCCKLLPISAQSRAQVTEAIPHMIDAGLASPDEFDGMLPEFDKPAGARCPHQRHHKGCTVYARRPFGCRTWNCRWLVNEAGATRRPDRAHYVIDIMPDFITLVPGEGAAPVNVEIIQIWLDPDYPDAHRDPALRAYLAEQGEHGKAALIRFNSSRAFVLIPPAMNEQRRWIEHDSQSTGHDHRGDDLLGGLASAQRVMLEGKSGEP